MTPEAGGAMSRISYRSTLMPHGAVAASSAAMTSWLMVLALLKGPVQLQLADGGTQSRLGKLHGTEHVITDAVGRFLGVHHLKVKHAVDVHAHVVAGDAGLLGHVQHLLLAGSGV